MEWRPGSSKALQIFSVTEDEGNGGTPRVTAPPSARLPWRLRQLQNLPRGRSPPRTVLPVLATVADQALSAPPPPGRRTVKTEPLPASLVTVTSPPIMRASLRERARPRPVPPKRCAVETSA